jgi:hypothetical protein
MRLALRLGFLFAGAAAFGVACGIDESGLQGDASADGGPKSDTGLPDVPNDVPLPPTCASTDVSCLGFDAGAPDGWAPFIVAASQCPAGDYASSPWVRNPALAPGSCSCGCAAQGAYACPAQITISNGGACGSDVTVDAGACQAQVPASMHMELGSPPTASGNAVSCAADASPAVAQSDPFVLCSAGCDAGAQAVCSAPVNTRCIAADGVQACPNGLAQHIVGVAAVASCNPCSCKPGIAPTCAATAQVFTGYFNGQQYVFDNNCQSGGQFTAQNLALNQTCQAANNNYDSFSVTWNALAAPTCTASPGGGDAGLAAVKTLCCK